MTRPTTAIGYIRVSTEMQDTKDHALETQAKKIRRFCSDRDIKLSGTFEDVGSAVDAFSLDRRPALQEATARAVREGSCLIVTEPTRLFRNVEVAERWLFSSGVSIFSVRDDKTLGRYEFLAAVEAGATAAKATQVGTVTVLGKKHAAGMKLGSPADKSAANAASKHARAQKSDSTVNAIALILREDSAYSDLSNRAFADLLNRRNLLTGWNRAWTTVGVKRQRSLAEIRLKEWQDLEDEVIEGEIELAPEAKVEPAFTTVTVSTEQEDEKAMLALPSYGTF